MMYNRCVSLIPTKSLEATMNLVGSKNMTKESFNIVIREAQKEI